MLNAEQPGGDPAVVSAAAVASPRLTVATATSPGDRDYQQDRLITSLDLASLLPPPPPGAAPPPSMDLVGVLDGHGARGGGIADLLKTVSDYFSPVP